MGPVTLLHPNAAVYNPTRYKLTDKEGIVYVINQETGLEKITDLNGNTITFTANGILHSAGPSVTFTRDAQDRITKITDPMKREKGSSLAIKQSIYQTRRKRGQVVQSSKAFAEGSGHESTVTGGDGRRRLSRDLQGRWPRGHLS